MVDPTDFEGHFSNYAEYSKTFRSWMVAYGIGGPVLFLTSKDAPQTIAKSANLKLIIFLFISGVALQILLAFINKWAAWHMYMGSYSKYQVANNQTDFSNHHLTLVYRIWAWINKQSWIDLVVDFGAISVFSIAT